MGREDMLFEMNEMAASIAMSYTKVRHGSTNPGGRDAYLGLGRTASSWLHGSDGTAHWELGEC
jgi:hypothetical protein